MINKKTRALLASLPVLFFSCLNIARSEDLQWVYLGEFSNENHSRESGDCDGYTVRLWKLNKEQIIGTYSHADGPCDKLPTPIYGVHYVPESHQITFLSPSDSDAIRETNHFSGVLSNEKLSGTLRTVNKANVEVATVALNLSATVDRQSAAVK